MTTIKGKKNSSDGAPGTIHGTTDARAFTARLKSLARHMDRAARIPILNCVTLEFAPMDILHASWFGVDFGMTAEIEGTGTGAIALPLRTLLAFVSNAGGETVAFSKYEDAPAVKVTCGAASADLIPLGIEGRFVHMLTDPETPSRKGIESRTFHFGEGVLQHVAGFVTPAISTEETRYYLNGVCFEFGTSTVRAVATDGHKLLTRRVETPAPVQPWKYRPILPRNALSAILGVMGAAQGQGTFEAIYIPEHEKEQKRREGPVKHTVREQWDSPCARFSGNGWTVTTKLIDGTFPDWPRVVPNLDGYTTVTLKTKQVLSATKMRAGVSGKHKGVALKLESQGTEALVASFKDHDFGTFTVPLDAEFSAPMASGYVGMNHAYLASIAKAFGTPEIVMHVGTSGDPMRIQAPGPVGEDFAVLMPMRV